MCDSGIAGNKVMLSPDRKIDSSAYLSRNDRNFFKDLQGHHYQEPEIDAEMNLIQGLILNKILLLLLILMVSI